MNKALHRFAVVTACCTFLLIVAGGMVTSTGSGLAVPDWPLSYGQIMPPMVGGIFYEHGHRMIASFVGFLTVILAFWLWRRDPRRWMRVLGLIALTAVIIQGILGGLTVLYLLPVAISVSHAALAQSFFCLTALIALFTSQWWYKATPVLEELTARRVFQASVLLVISVFLQLILGAVMRHTGSGLAIPDVPFAYGQILPSLAPESLQQYNDIQIKTDMRLVADGPLTAFQVGVHFFHRLWALAVFGIAIFAFVRFRSESGIPGRLRFLSGSILFLVFVQIALGVLTVLTRKNEIMTTVHVATGAVTLVVSVLLVLHVAKLGGATLSRFPLIRFRKEALV
ncbi:MAG: COX15/CtaA family protein [Bacteroidota bacterium]